MARDADFIPEPYQAWKETWGDIYVYKTDGLVQPGQSYPHLPSSTAAAVNYLDTYGYQTDANGERIAAANATGKSYFTVTEAHNRFWIPQSFIDESKSAIKQNAGY